MNIDKGLLAYQFYEFEEKYCNELKSYEFKGANAWQAVKFPLYIFLLDQYTTGHALATPKAGQSSRLKKIRGTIYSLALLLAFKIKVAAKRNSVLIYASSADKLAKDKNGLYFNFLVDGLISNRIVRSYIYAEKSVNGNFRYPSPVKHDFAIDSLDNVIALYNRYFRGNSHVREISKNIFDLLQVFFNQKGGRVDFTETKILEYVANYVAEYKVSCLFLKFCSPSFIVTSDKVSTGFIGAAKHLKIPSIDLQHGVIDQYHPQYIYSPLLLDAKDKISLPSYVGVFGDIHRQVLLKKGFWNNSEIVVLGSCRIDVTREKYNGITRRGPFQNEYSVLIPTQWTFFEETIALVASLAENNIGFKIKLKIHPLEPLNNISRYNDLVNRYAHKLTIANPDDDLHSLIISSFLMIGFDSAALLESIALNKPCVTIATEKAPEGIHAMFDDNRLRESVITLPLDEPNKIVEFISQIRGDEILYQKLVDKSAEQGERLYAKNYIDNWKTFNNMIDTSGEGKNIK